MTDNAVPDRSTPEPAFASASAPATGSASAPASVTPAVVPAPAPRQAPAARTGVVVVALALLAVAGFCGVELYATLADHRSSALGAVLSHGLEPALEWPYLAWAGGAVAACGLVFLVWAVRPRALSHRGIGTDPALWLSGTAVARLCSARARHVSGVASAITRVGRRRIEIAVHASGREPSEIDAEIRQALDPLLRRLGEPLALTVRVHTGSHR